MEQPGPSSTPQGNLPLGVDPQELYDGPRPVAQMAQGPPPMAPQPRVVQHPRAPMVDPRSLVQAIPPQRREVSSSPEGQAHVLSTALHLVAARTLGLIALLAACAIWGYAVYDPNTPRTTAATIFSVTVLFPVILLYWREYWKDTTMRP